MGSLVGLEGEQLGDDDGLSGGGGDHEGLALVVARAVLEQEVDHAQVAVPTRLHQASRALKGDIVALVLLVFTCCVCQLVDTECIEVQLQMQKEMLPPDNSSESMIGVGNVSKCIWYHLEVELLVEAFLRRRRVQGGVLRGVDDQVGAGARHKQLGGNGVLPLLEYPHMTFIDC